MTGYVYAIECGEAVKIGWGRNPERRLSELNVGAPTAHRLLGYVAATKEQERELHGLLVPYRIRGEWFRKDGAVHHFLTLLPARIKDATPRALPSEKSKANPKRGRSLAAYMAERQIGDAEMASKVGSSIAAVRKWRRGERIPRPALLVRISDATSGEVSPRDFIFPSNEASAA